MPVVTTIYPLRFDMEGVELEVQVLPQGRRALLQFRLQGVGFVVHAVAQGRKTRYWIDAPEEVRVDQVHER